VRRLIEAEIATVINGRQAFVGVGREVLAHIAKSARHERRDHDLRADRERIAHVVLGEVGTDLLDHARDLVAEGERPGQGLRPVTGEDVQVGPADAACGDAKQRGAWRYGRPRDGADHG
jgi:hypothetical protein